MKMDRKQEIANILAKQYALELDGETTCEDIDGLTDQLAEFVLSQLANFGDYEDSNDS